MAKVNQVDNALSGASGTGSFAGTTSPSFTTPALGTPSAGVLSSCTGYAQSALTGLGTGVSTALGNNVTGSGSIPLLTSGTWTPVLTFATPGDLSVSYIIQTGTYMKIGNMVTVWLSLVCTPTFTTASSMLEITGLPQTVNSSSPAGFGAVLYGQAGAWPVGLTNIAAYAPANTTQIRLYASGTASAGGSTINASNVSTGQQLILQTTISYYV